MGLAPTHSMVETPSREFYREAMEVLTRANVPFLVGGAFAFVHQAGIDRSTKDLDIFVRPADVQRLLEASADAGYEAELVFSHWLAKIRSPAGFIDVIFSSGNGVAVVDDQWFEHATERDVLGVRVLVAPPEESVWSKAFVMERERYDGADVAHIILADGDRMDWDRLLERFGPHWRVLLAHLILFGFIYPSQRVAGARQGHRGAASAGSPRRPRRRTPTIRSATARCSPGPSTWATCWAAPSATPGFAPTATSRRRKSPAGRRRKRSRYCQPRCGSPPGPNTA